MTPSQQQRRNNHHSGHIAEPPGDPIRSELIHCQKTTSQQAGHSDGCRYQTGCCSHEQKIESPKENSLFSLPISAYQGIHEELISKNKSQRLEIPGMISMRVDMIVVASCLIHFVLNRLQIKEITACSSALKEGLLAESIDSNTIPDIN